MQKVDAEINRIVNEQYGRAVRLLEENRDKVEAMTQALLDWETIDVEQIEDIMAGRPPRPPKPSQSGAGEASSDAPPPDAAPTTEATA